MSTTAYRIVSDTDPTAPRRLAPLPRATERERYGGRDFSVHTFTPPAVHELPYDPAREVYTALRAVRSAAGELYKAPWRPKAPRWTLLRWRRQGRVRETQTRSYLWGLFEVVTHPRPLRKEVGWFVVEASPLLGRPEIRIPLYST